MFEFTGRDENQDSAFKKYMPVLTAICCFASIVFFVGFNLERDTTSWEAYKRWGAPSSVDIFNGDYWGLFTSSFLHADILHIAFNLYWLWIFGKKIEFETNNKLYYGILIVTASIVSSSVQLAFSGTTGIGLSGIGYALFGYIYVKSKISKEYDGFLDQRTSSLFIFWLFLCMVLTVTNIWVVGNAAHVGGLFWGAIVAYGSRLNKFVHAVIILIVFTLLTSSIFWTPFSVGWLSHKAYTLHENQQTEEAMIVYKEILEKDPENEFAQVNIKQLEVAKLSHEAYRLHKNKDYKKAKELYIQILNIDKDNAWAKMNLDLLPKE